MGGSLRLLLENPGAWYSVSLSEVTGNNENKKTTSILTPAKSRGLKIQTKIEGERLYVPTVEGTGAESSGPA
jgi:hypothetical protein